MHGSETFFLDAGLYEGLAGFRYALRRFLKFSEAATRAAGITSQQYQALLVIKADPAGAIMVKDLADQLLNSTPQYSGADRPARERRLGRTETLTDRWPKRARRHDRNRSKIAGAVGFQPCQGAPQGRAVVSGSA